MIHNNSLNESLNQIIAAVDNNNLKLAVELLESRQSVIDRLNDKGYFAKLSPQQLQILKDENDKALNEVSYRLERLKQTLIDFSERKKVNQAYKKNE